MTQNVSLFCEECGYDVSTGKRHYYNRTVLPEVGADWFNVLPTGHEKITPLEQASA